MKVSTREVNHEMLENFPLLSPRLVRFSRRQLVPAIMCCALPEKPKHSRSYDVAFLPCSTTHKLGSASAMVELIKYDLIMILVKIFCK